VWCVSCQVGGPSTHRHPPPTETTHTFRGLSNRSLFFCPPTPPPHPPPLFSPAALTDPGFVGNKNGTLPPEAREGVVHTLTFASTCPALGLDAFRDMVGDLVRVVRAQAPLDALAAALRTVQGV
jgi:hypothetical protein